jgi:Ca2+-binding RTX toxin-like protein
MVIFCPATFRVGTTGSLAARATTASSVMPVGCFTTRGGDDRLFGGAGRDVLQGDADYMIGDAEGGDALGGDDRLSGGEGDDLLFGDAREMEDNAQGGNDTFVFDDAFGNDTVADFRQGEDELEFNVPGVTDVEDLQIAVVGPDTVITADTLGTVTLSGFTGVLTELEFDFV